MSTTYIYLVISGDNTYGNEISVEGVYTDQEKANIDATKLKDDDLAHGRGIQVLTWQANILDGEIFNKRLVVEEY